MLQSFSLLRPRPNGLKFNALHSKIVKCNVKKNFIFKITKPEKPLLKKMFRKIMDVGFVPAEFIHQLLVALRASGINPHTTIDIEHMYKYSFINRFSSRQLKVLNKNSSNRILVVLLAPDI